MTETSAQRHEFMRRAIALAEEAARADRGGPFSAVIVRDGQIIAEGWNQVTSSNDPTAHAEVVAIRNACRTVGSFNLDGCEIYCSCEPCPMCLSAIYWARVSRIYYANSRADAASIGFDDAFLYEELRRPLDERAIPIEQLLAEEAKAAFRQWHDKPDRIHY